MTSNFQSTPQLDRRTAAEESELDGRGDGPSAAPSVESETRLGTAEETQDFESLVGGPEGPRRRPRFSAKRFLLTLLMLSVIGSLTIGGVYWIRALEEPPAPTPTQSPVPVETVRISPRPFIHRLEALGTVRAFREAALGVKVSGPVSRVPEGIELGASVRRRALLAEIDPVPFQIEVRYREALLGRAQAELRRAQAVTRRQRGLIDINREKLRLARAEWKRLKGLFERGLIARQELERSELLVRRTQEELQRAQSALEELDGQRAMAASNVAAARAELSRAQQSLKDSQVRAPFSGVISEKVVTVGEMVSPGTVLFRLVDHDVVRVLIRAPAHDIGLLHPGLPAEVLVEGFSRPFRGKVAYVGPRADARTRTFPVEVLVDNTGLRRLLPGIFARARVPLKTYPSAILIPRSSVVAQEKGSAVFIVDPERRTAKKRPIRIARAFGSRLLISQGLDAGDLLVIRGQPMLDDGARVRVVESRHPGP
ncbi:MAG: efflux RND transporter periplasmic adaptor subunit [Nitrospinota bacterium]